MNVIARTVSLDDKYVSTRGQVYLTGIQALVRLPLDQARLAPHHSAARGWGRARGRGEGWG